MSYATTLTSKGQITIPKIIRNVLKLGEHNKLLVRLREQEREIVITAPRDFLSFAKSLKIKRKINPVKAREWMEKHYERA